MKPQTPEAAAIELVDRSRLGDQNATAMLVLIRKNASKGVARAKRAYQAAMAHAKGKKGAYAPGAEPLRQIKRAAPRVTDQQGYLRLVSAAPFAAPRPVAELLSRGPAISNDVLSLVGSTFGSEPEKKAYEYGVMGPAQGVRQALARSKPQFRRAIMTGHVMGIAKRLQAARAGNVAAISRKAAWELT